MSETQRAHKLPPRPDASRLSVTNFSRTLPDAPWRKRSCISLIVCCPHRSTRYWTSTNLFIHILHPEFQQDSLTQKDHFTCIHQWLHLQYLFAASPQSNRFLFFQLKSSFKSRVFSSLSRVIAMIPTISSSLCHFSVLVPGLRYFINLGLFNTQLMAILLIKGLLQYSLWPKRMQGKYKSLKKNFFNWKLPVNNQFGIRVWAWFAILGYIPIFYKYHKFRQICEQYLKEIPLLCP